jgi:hypothetical protein
MVSLGLVPVRKTYLQLQVTKVMQVRLVCCSLYQYKGDTLLLL